MRQVRCCRLLYIGDKILRFSLNFSVIKIPDKNRHFATRFVVKILHENRQKYYRQIILYCLTPIGEEGANSPLQYNGFNLTRTKMQANLN